MRFWSIKSNYDSITYLTWTSIFISKFFSVLITCTCFNFWERAFSYVEMILSSIWTIKTSLYSERFLLEEISYNVSIKDTRHTVTFTFYDSTCMSQCGDFNLLWNCLPGISPFGYLYIWGKFTPVMLKTV